MLMFSVKSCVYVTLVLLLFSFCSASRRNSGGSRRTSGSYGRGSRVTQNYARPTSSYRNVQSHTVGSAYATPRRAAQVTTPRYVIRTQPTIRTNQPSYIQPGYNQPTYNQPNYNQPGYKPGYNQPGYQQPGYNQPGYHPPGYNQPGYNQPGYHPPGYNQPGYNQPGYHPSYSQPSHSFPGSGTNYYQPGGYGGYGYKKDHGTRNAVFAGLGGSLLGAYLGYQIGSWSSGSSSNNNNGAPGAPGAPGAGPAGSTGSYDDVPRYSVVHYYYTGDRPIPKDVSVQSNSIGKCDNTTSFCAPNSRPLCMSNGTVYCITPLDSTVPCADNTTTASACVNSTINLPCVDVNGTACNTTSTNTTSIQIPCVTSISVFGSFDTNTLTVHKISNETEDTSVTGEGISTKFCVTVIADPVPKPVALTNEQFIKYVNENPEVKQEVNLKTENVLNTFLSKFFA